MSDVLEVMKDSANRPGQGCPNHLELTTCLSMLQISDIEL